MSDENNVKKEHLVDLDEIYPEMRKKEIEDEETANQEADYYKSMKDLPDKQ